MYIGTHTVCVYIYILHIVQRYHFYDKKILQSRKKIFKKHYNHLSPTVPPNPLATPDHMPFLPQNQIIKVNFSKERLTFHFHLAYKINPQSYCNIRKDTESQLLGEGHLCIYGPHEYIWKEGGKIEETSNRNSQSS